jgi:hypothetical protein
LSISSVVCAGKAPARASLPAAFERPMTATLRRRC